MPPIDDTTTGRAYWRSLDELANTREFQDWLAREFPKGATEHLSPSTRRQFLKVMGASLAFAGLGLAGCRWPQEKLAPYAYNPPGVDPGIPKSYATAMELGGVAAGLLVTSYDGRPIKIEGNPSHPVNQGAASAMQQASLLEMYDPDRSKFPVRRQGGQKVNSTWEEFTAFAAPHFEQLKAAGGKGFTIFSEASDSVTLRGLRERLLALFPQAKWYEHEPVSWDNEREGTRLAFGQPLRVHYDFTKAERIVCIDADLLQTHPDALKHTRAFAAWRSGADGRMNRLHVVESALSLTGAAADNRVARKPSDVAATACVLAAHLAHKLGVVSPGAQGLLDALQPFTGHALLDDQVRAMAIDLDSHAGKSIFPSGPREHPAFHALVQAVNVALGNAGRTVHYTAAPDPHRATHFAAADEALGEGPNAGAAAQTLLIIGGNPAYTLPQQWEQWRAHAGAGATTIHLSLHDDETSHGCTWHLPRAHFLEAWGDARAWDGTVSIVQPLIEPLYGGKTPAELLALCCGDAQAEGYDLVRAALKPLVGADFETGWTQALSDGVVPQTAWPTVQPTLAAPPWRNLLEPFRSAAATANGRLELVLAPDMKTYDGRFANNGWLQELPDPLSKITWDNALLLSVGDAKALGIKANDVVRVALDAGGSAGVDLPAYLMPGQAAGCAVIALGYGRAAAGRVGDKVGVSAYRFVPAGTGAKPLQVQIAPTGKRHKLAVTQDHFVIDSVGFKEQQRRIGPLVREGTLNEYKANPGFAQEMAEVPPLVSMWTEKEYEGHRWGMAIDLSSCTGCGACVIACQAENNIPVVGKTAVARGREMHWIRIDRYFTGEPEQAQVRHQPLACHHCELAPCEQVCPVAATVHSSEGLNDMVYNRCVGTRYCSNNCPYKVRRFNYFNFRKHMTETEKLATNPEVTVRSRGVMEKCTYCVQRIQAVKIAAKNGQRPIADGEIVPACAQTCPAQAIVFGDLNDTASRVRRMQDHERSYRVLAELNVKPRTAYLAKLRNPAPGAQGSGPHGMNAMPGTDGAPHGSEPVEQGVGQ